MPNLTLDFGNQGTKPLPLPPAPNRYNGGGGGRTQQPNRATQDARRRGQTRAAQDMTKGLVNTTRGTGRF